jgi:hypothetical protein
MDVTEHPTANGKAYLAVVLDAFSRRVVGWSIADHTRAELVVDALQMAIWRRCPPAGQTIAHSDHGSTYTSWAFGRRLRGAGLLGSMDSIGDCFDNSVAESFFGTLQLELLGEHHWESRQQLAQAIFEWIEAGTTRGDATVTARCSVRSTTKPLTRHDQQPTAIVRRAGEAHLRPRLGRTRLRQSNVRSAPEVPNGPPFRTGHSDIGSARSSAEHAELLHHGDGVSDTPSFDGLTSNEAKASHRLPLCPSARWFDSLKVAEVSPAPLNKRHSTIAFTHEPDDLFLVIRKGLSDQFDRGPVTLASGALESWHFDVIDEPIGDQLVNELETPAGPYLIGDSA